MAEVPDSEDTSPTTSFRGRLDITNFTFTAQRHPEIEVPSSSNLSVPSRRLASRSNGSPGPWKPDADSQTSSSAARKRNADALLLATSPIRPTESDTDGTISSVQSKTTLNLSFQADSYPTPTKLGVDGKMSWSSAEKLDANVLPQIPKEADSSLRPTKLERDQHASSSETKKRKADELLATSTKIDSHSTRPNWSGKVSSSRTKKLTTNVSSDTMTTSLAETLTTPTQDDTAIVPTRTPPKRRNRPPSSYAPPSAFAHLGADPLPDALGPRLLVLFCGLNPGIATATTGHAYSSPTNRFWPLMHASGVLPARCTAADDASLPARFRLGLTNLVARPSRNGAQLRRAELDAGVPALEAKARRWRPEVVCLVGKGIWEAVWRVHHGGRALGKAFHKEFAYGWQGESENVGVGEVGEDEKVEGVVYDGGWKGARVFVASSTSGLAATLKPAEKERIWRELGVWVEKRRAALEGSDKWMEEGGQRST